MGDMNDGGIDDVGFEDGLTDADTGTRARPPAPRAPRRLYREPEEKKLSGVCGGLADYFGLDPTVVRLAVVVIGFATGFAGVVAYIVATFVIPLRPEDVPRTLAPPGSLSAGTSKSNGLLIALLVATLLVIVGGRWSWWWFEAPLVGLTLLAIGVWLLLSRDERPSEEISPTSATWSAGGTTLVGEAASARDQIDDPWTTVSSSESDDSAGPRGEVPPPVPPWGPTSPPPSLPSEPTSAQGFPAAMLALLLIVAGIVALCAVLDVWDVSFQNALGIGLLVIGGGLVVGAWRGRARPLLALGLPALGVLVCADTIDLPLDAGTGERRIEVTTMTELRQLDDTHELLAGELEIDLTHAPLGRPGAPTPTLTADVGLGNVIVRLPPDVTADIDMDVGAGSVQVDGEDEGGIDVERSLILDGEPGGGQITLDLHVGLGEVEVFHG
jgi:phage shock protein PspC (stress-responsive transcriptional regulator)